MTLVHKDEIWVIGGRDKFGNISKSVEGYKLSGSSSSSSSSGFWKQKTPLPLPIMLGAGISMGGNLFVIGGITGSVDKPEVLDKIYVFNES